MKALSCPLGINLLPQSLSPCALPIGQEVTSQKSHRHSDSAETAWGGCSHLPLSPSAFPQTPPPCDNTTPVLQVPMPRASLATSSAWQPCIEDSMERWLLQKWGAHGAGAGGKREAKALARGRSGRPESSVSREASY